MSELPTIDTPENWSAASHGYATKVAPFMMETYAEEFVNRLDLRDHHETLEVACGSGALTSELAKYAQSVLATDFSEKMLEFAKKKVDNAGLSNVSFQLMDGMDLQIEDNTMDRAACSFGLMLFPDRHKGFTELRRVLRSGGKAMVSGWGGPDKFEGFAIFMNAIQRAFPDFPKPDSPPPIFTLADLENFKQQMEAAGFKDVSTDYVTRELLIDSFDGLWAMMTTGAPPIKMFFQKVGSNGIEKLRDALAAIVNEKFGNGTIILKNAATVGVGTVK